VRAWTGHPLWLVGFRPFFILASVAGVVLPLTWALLFTGTLAPPPGVTPLPWHAHEMFFGFGLAVVGGFLLTATKNWVQVRGHYGHTLQYLTAAWLFERAGMWWGGAWPAALRFVSLHLYLVSLVGLVWWTLVRHRRTDSYRDNVLFLIALPVLELARTLLLSPTHFAEGRDLTLGIFRLFFVVMLERTLVPFMKGTFKVELPRRPWLDTGIKVLALSLLAAPWMPEVVRPAVQLALAVLFTGRLLTWSPHVAFRKLEVGVMYVGGLALATQLVLDALGTSWVGALATHVFTFGTMGLIIPAMFIRIAHGHTGRPIRFGWLERAALGSMALGLVARVVAPQLAPERYFTWVSLAAAGWSLCFALIAVRITPLLLAERVDGKEH